MYSCTVHPDSKTKRLREAVESIGGDWYDSAEKDDNELASQIRSDGVDILVDLTGHTANNRLGVFAMKPSPIQVKTTTCHSLLQGLSAASPNGGPSRKSAAHGALLSCKLKGHINESKFCTILCDNIACVLLCLLCPTTVGFKWRSYCGANPAFERIMRLPSLTWVSHEFMQYSACVYSRGLHVGDLDRVPQLHWLASCGLSDH